MARIAVIGICGNSVFLTVDHFHRPGETLVADSVYEEIGGKGINQAVAAARMGAQVSFLAAIGSDADGKKCREVAAAEGLCAHFAEKAGERTTFAFILTDSDGDNRVTEYEGAALSVEDVRAFADEIKKSDFLLLQHEVPPEVNRAALEIAAESGVRVILNPAPIAPIDDETARMVYLVTPNEQEAAAIDPDRFQNVIVTLGKRGCSVNGSIVSALPVQAVDTTGAGDTFNGALATCLADGMEMKQAARIATVASGISVTRRYVLGAIPYKNEVERILNHE